MFDAAIHALMVLLDPVRLLFMFLGLIMGIIIGILPGLGGMTGMALLLPFLFGMDPYTAMALLIGMVAITHTSDSITSILFGVPGTSGAQCTVMDGYPLAQKGEAARALGAAFISSMFGGIVGAVILFVSIPMAKPIINTFGSPELFMLCLFGICMIGVFTGKRRLRGIMAGLFGLLVGTVGAAPAAPEYRYTFGLLYLENGVALILVTLGLFAIPEMIGLLSSSAMKSTAKLAGSSWQGFKDVLKNKWLVLQGSAIGTFVGFLPGLGGSIADWAAYTLAKKTVKNEQFGKGDIRGIIAPESSNNAKEGGSLIPTLLFGIPGSGTTAVLLLGFMLLGIQAGPKMITDHLDITLTIVWTLVLANIFGTALCFLISKPMSKVRSINPNKLVPFVLVIIFIGAYQATNDWGDYILLMCFGVLGWVMRDLGWPRIPFIIGIILSQSAERYLFLSLQRYEAWELLSRPGVIIIGLLILLTFLGGILSNKLKAIFHTFFNKKGAGVPS